MVSFVHHTVNGDLHLLPFVPFGVGEEQQTLRHSLRVNLGTSTALRIVLAYSTLVVLAPSIRLLDTSYVYRRIDINGVIS